MASRTQGPGEVPQLGLHRGLGVPWGVPLPGLLGQEWGPPKQGRAGCGSRGSGGEHG